MVLQVRGKRPSHKRKQAIINLYVLAYHGVGKPHRDFLWSEYLDRCAMRSGQYVIYWRR